MFVSPVDSVLDTRGGTPLVVLQRIGLESGATRAWIGLKLESLNLTGSSLDRIATALVEDGERSGALVAGGRIIEASSGNLGIALAAAAARRGYSLTVVMPESASPERQATLHTFGATVELTADSTHMAGAVARAEELGAMNPDAFLPRQFRNPLLPQIYEETLGAELISTARADGVGPDVLVAAVGTGAILAGSARALRKGFPGLHVVAAIPQTSPHHLQGASLDLPVSWGSETETLRVPERTAVDVQRRLSAEEGILAGFSSGLAVAAALIVASTLRAEQRIYVVGHDTGERYFSLQGYFS